MVERGSESTRRSHMEHPIVDTDFPPIQRTNEGRIYSCLLTMDGGPRPKCMAYKHPRPKYYTLMYMRIAYSVSTLYTTILQPPLSKGLVTRQCRHK